MTSIIKHFAAAIFITFFLTGCSDIKPNQNYTDQASDTRTQSSINRDGFRHPNETLSFFELQDNQVVVEIWPGSGWYTEILAPYLKTNGTYYAAHFSDQSNIPFFIRMRNQFNEKIKSLPNVYKNTITTNFEPPKELNISPQQSANRVLTFRNVHNWMKSNSAPAAFDSFYTALKPGGILGVVEHRAPESFTKKQMITSGYVSESYVKLLAKNAGFVFIGGSEINANPKDTKNYAKGVWTLPPTLRLGEKEKMKYMDIGESDRMTLKFKKPL